MSDENESVYVCRRVADLSDPNGEALTDICSECKEPIYKMPYAPTHMPLICDYCAIEMMMNMDDGDTLKILPGDMAKLQVN